MIDLNTIWFLVIGVAVAGYAILEGFDLGVGILSLFDRADRRHLYMRSIDYTWDANQVWFILTAGAFFAAFPPVYATVFSGFYVPLFLLLAALIFRAVSFEFRHNAETTTWRRVWELCFGLGSLGVALLVGITFGNILHGLPLDANGNYTGPTLGLFNPYALLVALLALALFVMHGAAYLALKTQGDINARAVAWTRRAGWLSLGLFAGALVSTFLVSPFLFDGLLKAPLFYLVAIALIGSFGALFHFLRINRSTAVFAATSGVFVSMLALAGLGLFPRFIPARPDLGLSLTIYDSASTPRSLTMMLIITLTTLPLVLAYTAYIHWIFRGKVDTDEHGAEANY